MQAKTITVGQVVRSRAGRDAGKYFLAYQLLDEDFCLIVDGRSHKLAKPKRKRIKHVEPNELVAESIREKWLTGKKVFDSEIASFLKELNHPRGVEYAEE